MCWHASLIAWNLFVTAMAKKMFSRHDSINRFFLEKVSAAGTHSLSVSEGCIAEIILKPTVCPWKSMVGSWKLIHFLWGKRPISGVNLLFVSVSVSCNYSSGNDHMGPTKREVGKIVGSKAPAGRGYVILHSRVCTNSQTGDIGSHFWGADRDRVVSDRRSACSSGPLLPRIDWNLKSSRKRFIQNTMGTHVSLIFRGYFTHISRGYKPSFFHGFLGFHTKHGMASTKKRRNPEIYKVIFFCPRSCRPFLDFRVSDSYGKKRQKRFKDFGFHWALLCCVDYDGAKGWAWWHDALGYESLGEHAQPTELFNSFLFRLLLTLFPIFHHKTCPTFSNGFSWKMHSWWVDDIFQTTSM